ncbi:hypothetical protein HYQ44_003221 [Verticillium longisporum]|nr:hypothetical protein HYQ44_003221 [Verticillium longisporum]
MGISQVDEAGTFFMLLPLAVLHFYDEGNTNGGWPAWMSMKSIPVTVQPWFTPPPPPVPVAVVCPKVGDVAPLDRDRKLIFGGGRPVLLVFLRCVGCAFAQKTFLALRAISVKHQIACVAVSHSSQAATQKWLDLMGGAWNVEVVIDEDRAIYAAWGLGLCSVWHMFNPSSQVQGWKETGWLGEKVAGAMKRPSATSRRDDITPTEAKGKLGRINTASNGRGLTQGPASARGAKDENETTMMGNKWQTAGAFAVDGRGTVVWGGKALKVDDVLDLDMGIKILKGS